MKQLTKVPLAGEAAPGRLVEAMGEAGRGGEGADMRDERGVDIQRVVWWGWA